MATKKKPAARPAGGTTAPAARGVKVRATRLGYYGEARRREGDVFTIASPAHFSKTWMEHVDKTTPEHTTSAPAALAKEMTATARGKGKNADDPLG